MNFSNSFQSTNEPDHDEVMQEELELWTEEENDAEPTFRADIQKYIENAEASKATQSDALNGGAFGNRTTSTSSTTSGGNGPPDVPGPQPQQIPYTTYPTGVAIQDRPFITTTTGLQGRSGQQSAGIRGTQAQQQQQQQPQRQIQPGQTPQPMDSSMNDGASAHAPYVDPLDPSMGPDLVDKAFECPCLPGAKDTTGAPGVLDQGLGPEKNPYMLTMAAASAMNREMTRAFGDQYSPYAILMSGVSMGGQNRYGYRLPNGGNAMSLGNEQLYLTAADMLNGRQDVPTEIGWVAYLAQQFAPVDAPPQLWTHLAQRPVGQTRVPPFAASDWSQLASQLGAGGNAVGGGGGGGGVSNAGVGTGTPTGTLTLPPRNPDTDSLNVPVPVFEGAEYTAGNVILEAVNSDPNTVRDFGRPLTLEDLRRAIYANTNPAQANKMLDSSGNPNLTGANVVATLQLNKQRKDVLFYSPSTKTTYLTFQDALVAQEPLNGIKLVDTALYAQQRRRAELGQQSALQGQSLSLNQASALGGDEPITMTFCQKEGMNYNEEQDACQPPNTSGVYLRTQNELRSWKFRNGRQ